MKKLIRKYITQMPTLQTFVQSFFVFFTFYLAITTFQSLSLPPKAQ